MNKILFENLRNLGIDKSFEDLDVDGNGVIDDKDKSLAVNGDIQNAITIALNAADDDAELVATKTGSQKDKYGINTTDAANFDNDVRNSKGTTYVVLGNTVGCSYCKKLAKAMAEQLNDLEGVANIYNMEWNDNRDLCWDIVKQGGIKGSVDFPQIAKFVDGQFVELVDNSREPEKAILNMINGAGAANSTGNDNTDNTLAAASNNTKTTLSEEDKAKLDALRKELAQVEERITAINEEIKKLQEDNLKLQEEQEKILKEQERDEMNFKNK